MDGFAPLLRQRREAEREGTSSVCPDASLGLRLASQLPQRGSLLDVVRPDSVKTVFKVDSVTLKGEVPSKARRRGSE